MFFHLLTKHLQKKIYDRESIANATSVIDVNHGDFKAVLSNKKKIVATLVNKKIYVFKKQHHYTVFDYCLQGFS